MAYSVNMKESECLLLFLMHLFYMCRVCAAVIRLHFRYKTDFLKAVTWCSVVKEERC